MHLRLLSSNSRAIALCLAASVAVGLMFGTSAGHMVAVYIGGFALFAILVWDLRLVVPVLIVTLPFAPKFPMSFGNLYVTTVILIIAYVAAALRAAARPGASLRYNEIALAALALVFSFALSGIQNYQYILSNRPLLLKLIQFALYTGSFVMVYQMNFTQSQRRVLIAAILLTGVIEGAIGALQWKLRPGLYVHGTIDYGHNLFAAYVTFLAVIMVGVVLESRSLAVRLAGLAGIAVMLYSIVFSFSRTAYVSILVSFGMFALMPLSRVKRAIVPAACLVVLLVTLVVVPVSVVERMEDILHTASGEVVALSFKFRLMLWKVALRGFLDSPVIGQGPGAYVIEDNFYVKAAAEAGLIGLVAFLALIWFVLRDAWRAARVHLRDDFMRGVAVGFVPAAFGALVVFNLAGDFMGVTRFVGMFWITLALLLRYVACDSQA